MTIAETDKRTIVKSIRISPKELDLIQSQCRNGTLGFSGFARAAIIAKVNEQDRSGASRPMHWLIR
jgi:hypothetical protein